MGVTGIEPVTPSMSTKCSPAELYAHPVAAAEAALCGEKASNAQMRRLQASFSQHPPRNRESVKNQSAKQDSLPDQFRQPASCPLR